MNLERKKCIYRERDESKKEICIYRERNEYIERGRCIYVVRNASKEREMHLQGER